MSDTLSALAEAVHRLQHVIKSIGPDIELTAIEIGGSRYASHILDTALLASPSFLRRGSYPDARNSPQIKEVVGVQIHVASTS